MKPLRQLIYDYLEYLTSVQGAQATTITNYEHYLERLLAFTGEITIDELTPTKIREFRTYLASTGIARPTANYHLIALRSFLKYLDRNDIDAISYTKVEVQKQVRPIMPVLNADEAERLLRSALGNNLISLRDRTILELLLGSGLRVAEICSLDRQQVENKTAFTIRGKGSKDRLIFLTTTGAKWLNRWLSVRDDDEPALFVELATTNRKRLQPRSVQRIVKHHSQLAGITKQITPHSCRHTFATNLYANGLDIRTVQELLGHASISTTEIYTHISNPQLATAHAKYSGYNRKDNL